MGAFNWDGEYGKIRVVLAEYGLAPDDELVDWFKQAKVAWPDDGVLVLNLKPHESICLVATPRKKQKPTVVS